MSKNQMQNQSNDKLGQDKGPAKDKQGSPQKDKQQQRQDVMDKANADNKQKMK